MRKAAATALGSISRADDEIVRWLVRSLNEDRSPDVKQGAAYALLRIGPNASGAVPTLEAALSSSYPGVRKASAFALGAMGEAAGEAAASLAVVLQDRDREVRKAAVIALAGLGPHAEPAIPAIIRAVRTSGSERHDAIETLGAVGPGASAAVPVLRDMLTAPDHLSRQYAATALGRIGAIEALPDLRKLRNDPEIETRYSADEAIRAITKRQSR